MSTLVFHKPKHTHNKIKKAHQRPFFFFSPPPPARSLLPSSTIYLTIQWPHLIKHLSLLSFSTNSLFPCPPPSKKKSRNRSASTSLSITAYFTVHRFTARERAHVCRMPYVHAHLYTPIDKSAAWNGRLH